MPNFNFINLFSKKMIEIDKFLLHEPFCIRNVIRCEICDEPINRDEKDDHFNENHKLQDCGDCGKKLEKRLLSSHKKKCLEKPALCGYCELSMPRSELQDHEYICGSKTEKCHLCGQLVPIMGKKDYNLII